MSTTLNLADRLLAMGRKYQALGRDQDARHILGRLAGFRQLPAEISEESQARLAELLLRCGRYVRARRHLTAILVQRPDSARYHYLMASALNGDTKCDPQRAAEHYRKSLQLDAAQPCCLGEFGLLALRLGRTEEGLASLRRAVELAPDDPEAVGMLAEGLRQEGLMEEARAALRAAQFRNPRDGRFHKLFNDFQFHLLHAEQAAEQYGESMSSADMNGPKILPFARPMPEETSAALGRGVRRHAGAPPPPPHSPQPARLPDKKHAQ